MKNIFLILLLFGFFVGFSQTSVNYKYAIVPSKFSFLKETDQYRLNSLSKMYMEYYGFQTFFENDILPTDLANQKCKALYVEVVENNTLFMSKLTVVIKDCTNKVLYTSIEGTSREKEYQIAYTQALREAFKSISAIKQKSQSIQVSDISNQQNQNNEINNLIVKNIENGFEIQDVNSNVILTLLKTSVKDFFIASKSQITGVLLLKDNQWYFEYYQKGMLISEKINISF